MTKTQLATCEVPAREQLRGSPLPDRLLSLDAAARFLGISPHTLRKYLAKGEMPRVKLLRRVLIDPADLQAFIERHKETRGRFLGG